MKKHQGISILYFAKQDKCNLSTAGEGGEIMYAKYFESLKQI